MIIRSDEIDLAGVRGQSGGPALAEESSDGLGATSGAVDGEVVDIHADEALGIGAAGAGLCEVERVVDAAGDAGAERVLDGAAQNAGESARGVWTEALIEVAPDGVAAEGQREVGAVAPPGAEIGDGAERVVGVGDLRFVDDETGIDLFVEHTIDDLVKWNDAHVDIASEEEAQREDRGGLLAGDADDDIIFEEPFDGMRFARDDLGAIPIAHTAAAGGERVAMAYVRIGVHGACGDVEIALCHGASVEDIDVVGDGAEAEGPGVDGRLALGAGLDGPEGPPHEGIVGVGGVSDGEFDGSRRGHAGW